MPKGQIIRAVSNFYYVEYDNKVLECKARGLFKKNKQSPLVGDFVTFEIVNEDQGFITELDPRENELRRPPISNVDQTVLVFSVKEPDFSQHLLDKFLVHVEHANIQPIIVLSKVDLLDEPATKLIDFYVKLYKEIGYKIMKTSKFNKITEELRSVLSDKVTVFSGQSGVGKSTILNSILPELDLDTAIISKKLGRGKHTTRFVQLIPLPEGGKVADTPGFSQLDFKGIESDRLDELFIEFEKYSQQCRFRGCSHDNEPGCMVKTAVTEDKINKQRYQHYLMFLHEIKEIEDNKWR